MSTDAPRPRPEPSSTPTRRSASSQVDPRTVKLAALVLFGAILAGVLAFAVLADTPEPTRPTGNASIIPKPNEGTGPADSGDRGGWEQLVLMGGIVAALTGIALFAVRGRGSRTRPGRAAWEAAAASGRDGAVDGRVRPDAPRPDST
jgi:hypothetical protein